MESKDHYSLLDLYVLNDKLLVRGALGRLVEKLNGNSVVITQFGIKFLDILNYRNFISLLRKGEASLSKGYYIELEFEGLGYRFVNLKNELILRVGYSHYVYFKIPKNILLLGFRKNLILFSVSKKNLNQIVYLVSSLKKYNNYKKKGVFKKGEVIVLKETKVGKK